MLIYWNCTKQVLFKLISARTGPFFIELFKLKTREILPYKVIFLPSNSLKILPVSFKWKFLFAKNVPIKIYLYGTSLYNSMSKIISFSMEINWDSNLGNFSITNKWYSYVIWSTFHRSTAHQVLSFLMSFIFSSKIYILLTHQSCYLFTLKLHLHWLSVKSLLPF